MTARMKEAFIKYNKSDKLHKVRFYQRHFNNLTPKTLLEIGVAEGDSLRAWKEIFPDTQIFGIDNKEMHKRNSPDLDVFVGDQRSTIFLDEVIKDIGIPDIIIDDGGHTRTCQVKSIKHLFPLLKKGGVYVIEDIGTSYFTDYNDDELSIIEYIKSLIDPTNFDGLRRFGDRSWKPHYAAYSITFEYNICILRK